MRDGIKTELGDHRPFWSQGSEQRRPGRRENRRQAAPPQRPARPASRPCAESSKKLRPKEVIGKESFNYAWGKAKGMIADYASAQSNGQPNSAGQSAQEHELPSWPATCNPWARSTHPTSLKTLKELGSAPEGRRP